MKVRLTEDNQGLKKGMELELKEPHAKRLIHEKKAVSVEPKATKQPKAVTPKKQNKVDKEAEQAQNKAE